MPNDLDQIEHDLLLKLDGAVEAMEGLGHALEDGNAPSASAANYPQAPPEYRSLDSRLPPGATIDLSLRTITVEGTTYALPDTGAAIPPSVPQKKPDQFTTSEWLAVARRANLLHAVNIESVLTNGLFAKTERPALEWMVPETSGYLDTTMDQEILTRAFQSEFERSKAIGGTVSMGAHVETPFVSAAAKGGESLTTKISGTDRRVFMLGLYAYPHAKLNLELCTRLSQGFIDDLEAAISNPEGQQVTKLKAVFARYGHVVPNFVSLGGRVTFTKEATVHAEADEKEAENNFTAAIDAKVQGIGGGAEYSETNGDHILTQQSTTTEAIRYSGKGGDRTLVNNIPEWVSTTAKPDNWQVIAHDGTRSLIELLEKSHPDLARRVISVWETHRREAWGLSTAPEHSILPRAEALPPFGNQPFIIATTLGAPLPSVGTKKAYLHGVPGVPGMPIFETLTLAPENRLARPVKNHLQWRLVYTGLCTRGRGRGSPIYWIVENRPEMTAGEALCFSKYWPLPTARVLGAFKLDGLAPPATLSILDMVSIALHRNHEIERHPASFTVTKVGSDKYLFYSMVRGGMMHSALETSGHVVDVVGPEERAIVPTTTWTAWPDVD
jgi:hypothetical protein